MTTDTAPLVFLMGTTGQTGRLILQDFDRNPSGVRIRIGVRKQKDLDRLHGKGRDAGIPDDSCRSETALM
jgi:hypothetical protein